jgi:hypothetical protein
LLNKEEQEIKDKIDVERTRTLRESQGNKGTVFHARDHGLMIPIYKSPFSQFRHLDVKTEGNIGGWWDNIVKEFETPFSA